MPSFVIEGGKKLHGEVVLQGSKNAAGPIIAATVLTSAPCVLRNVPRVQDVFFLLDILKKMGSRQRWIDEHTIEIINDALDPAKLDNTLVSKIRLSLLLIGPMLARYRSLVIAPPGGCNLGARSIDVHVRALEESGVAIDYDSKEKVYHMSVSQEQAGDEIVLSEFSVTGTENMLMLHARNERGIAIQLAAAEPHVQDLGLFLQKLGVSVSGLGTHTIRVKGCPDSGKPVEHTITPDYLECGTFLVLGAAAKSQLRIKNAPREQLGIVIQKLKEFGALVEFDGVDMLTVPSRKLVAAKLQTLPYPGFPTDLQAPFGVLATQAEGTTLIFDTLFENRLRYIGELQKMGATAVIHDPHRASVTGPTALYGIDIESFDIRSGATLVIAGLIASGKSVIHGVEQIDRGYENFDVKLRALGADIQRAD
jgi:UDP-N-acetylglucosamine 1-carboxyvinyltransferase